MILKQNVILLSAPMSGARPVAEALISQGWKTPGALCLPDRRDPSLSSLESESIVSANNVLLNQLCKLNDWGDADRLNWASMFELNALEDVPREWADHFQLSMQQRHPVVVKDPQLARTFGKWKKILQPAVVVVLFRFPVDFIASVMDGCDKGWWPEVPKDPDYLCRLWMDYYTNILSFHDQYFVYAHFTDQMCTPKGVEILNSILGSNLQPFKRDKVTHLIRRDTANLPKATWQLYDKLQFAALSSFQHQSRFTSNEPGLIRTNSP